MSLLVTLLWVGLVAFLWVGITAGIWSIVYAGGERQSSVSGTASNEYPTKE